MFSADQTLERLRDAHTRLLARLDELTDPVVARPSKLPGWTVGHVLSHLARNADSVVRRLDGAARDEIVDQYSGGKPGRAAEIEAGAHRGAGELVADVRATALAAELAVAQLPAEAWQRLSRSSDGQLVPASKVVISRINEVEIHHVDLGLGFTPDDWPADFRDRLLAEELLKLHGRADRAQLLAWLLGRGPAPELSAWR